MDKRIRTTDQQGLNKTIWFKFPSMLNKLPGEKAEGTTAKMLQL